MVVASVVERLDDVEGGKDAKKNLLHRPFRSIVTKSAFIISKKRWQRMILNKLVLNLFPAFSFSLHFQNTLLDRSPTNQLNYHIPFLFKLNKVV